MKTPQMGSVMISLTEQWGQCPDSAYYVQGNGAYTQNKL